MSGAAWSTVLCGNSQRTPRPERSIHVGGIEQEGMSRGAHLSGKFKIAFAGGTRAIERAMAVGDFLWHEFHWADFA